MAEKPPYRHRCYCCIGRTWHESGHCITCGAVGHLFDSAETQPDIDLINHQYIITTGGQTCKLNRFEQLAALAFIEAGEPNNWEPEDCDGT